MNSPSEKEFELMALIGTGELSGRRIAKAYETETGQKISYGTLYTTLRRLSERKWVHTREDQDEDGRIKFFSLSGEGQRVIKTRRERFASLATLGMGLNGAVS